MFSFVPHDDYDVPVITTEPGMTQAKLDAYSSSLTQTMVPACEGEVGAHERTDREPDFRTIGGTWAIEMWKGESDVVENVEFLNRQSRHALSILPGRQAKPILMVHELESQVLAIVAPGVASVRVDGKNYPVKPSSAGPVAVMLPVSREVASIDRVDALSEDGSVIESVATGMSSWSGMSAYLESGELVSSTATGGRTINVFVDRALRPRGWSTYFENVDGFLPVEAADKVDSVCAVVRVVDPALVDPDFGDPPGAQVCIEAEATASKVASNWTRVDPENSVLMAMSVDQVRLEGLNASGAVISSSYLGE